MEGDLIREKDRKFIFINKFKDFIQSSEKLKNLSYNDMMLLKSVVDNFFSVYDINEFFYGNELESFIFKDFNPKFNYDNDPT